MDLGRAVVDAEGADFAEHLFDDGIAGDAGAAHHLHAAIGDAHQGFGHRNLGHRAFDRAELAGVEHARAPVDHQLGLLQVDQVLGQHEADAFVIDQWLAEGVAAAGIIAGDLVGAGRSAPPAHAVRQAGRGQAHLRVFEAVAALAQHLVGGHAQVVDRDDGMAAGHGTVDGVEHALDADRGIGQIDQEHARAVVRFRHHDADLRAFRAGDERLAAVDHPVVAVELRGGLHHRRVRAGAAFAGRFGHEERRTRFAADQLVQEPRLLFVARHLAQQVHVAFVGRCGVARDGTERRQARFLQHDRGLRLRQVAAIGQDMRRQHPGVAREAAHFQHQFLRRPMRPATRIAFVWRDHIPDETLDLGGNGIDFGGGQMGHGVGLPDAWRVLKPGIKAMALINWLNCRGGLTCRQHRRHHRLIGTAYRAVCRFP